MLLAVIVWTRDPNSLDEEKFDHRNLSSIEPDVYLSDEEKLEFFKKRFYSISSCGTNFQASFDCAVDCFIKNGNCIPVNHDQIVTLNPTLLKNGILEMNIASNPFDAYFPIPFNEDSASSETSNTDIYSYCKAKLGSLVSDFLKRKDRIKFNFHFEDCLELCLYKEDLKRICHVIYCSISIEHNLGLPNLFTAAKECLSDSTDSAVLLTNINLASLSNKQHCSPLEYIETVLSCPLSMVPTLYGLKLSNHLKLGSPVCINLHDTITKYFLTLKWQKAPGYSSNIKIDISPPLKKAIGLLATSRFNITSPHPFYSKLYTYHFIIKSLVSRCRLFQDISFLQSLVQTEVLEKVTENLGLAWRTEKAWMNGEPVLAYSFGKFRQQLRRSLLVDIQLEMTSTIFLALSVPSETIALSLQHGDLGYKTEDLMSERHCIGLSSCNRENTYSYLTLKVKDVLNPLFSFLLPKDHGLDSSVFLWVLELAECSDKAKCLMLPSLAECCTRKVCINPTPFSLRPNPLHSTPETERGLQVVKCSETENRYDLDITVRAVPISSADGIYICFYLV